jgi:hypothetical protein
MSSELLTIKSDDGHQCTVEKVVEQFVEENKKDVVNPAHKFEIIDKQGYFVVFIDRVKHTLTLDQAKAFQVDFYKKIWGKK